MRPIRRARWRASLLVCVVLGLRALPGGAQSLPSYAPINPVETSRSGLATQPFLDLRRPWSVALQSDYASVIEYAEIPGLFYVLDAEVLRLQLSVARRLGAKGFVLAEGSLNGAYDGFLDGFFNWYHKLTGFKVRARELRPNNEFAYEFHYDGPPGDITYRPTDGFLGDIRIGAGYQHSSHAQSFLSVTLPTGTGPAGYRRGTVSINATTMLRSEFGKRFGYEGTFGVGYTPRHGDLKELERTVFLMVTQGVRGRVSGPFHLYANLVYHSSLYHNALAKGLNNRELTVDAGGLLAFRRGPAWSLGLSEDLEPKGPSVDLSFRFGVRW